MAANHSQYLTKSSWGVPHTSELARKERHIEAKHSVGMVPAGSRCNEYQYLLCSRRIEKHRHKTNNGGKKPKPCLNLNRKHYTSCVCQLKQSTYIPKIHIWYNLFPKYYKLTNSLFYNWAPRWDRKYSDFIVPKSRQNSTIIRQYFSTLFMARADPMKDNFLLQKKL